MRKLDQAPERGRPGIEGCRPGIDLRDVTETACQRLQQLFLLLRRTDKDARLVHAFPVEVVSDYNGIKPEAWSLA